MGYSFNIGGICSGYQKPLVSDSIPLPIFDFDYLQTGKFVLENSGGVDYVESYTDQEYLLNKNGSVSPTLRPFLDSTGVRFQDNNFSHLLSNITLPHKEMWFVFNCLEGTNYDATNGNPLYTNKNTSTVPILRGNPNTKTFAQSGFGTGAAGQISNTSWTTFTNLGSANNADPTNAFRVLWISFPNLTTNCMYLGGGSVSAGSIASLRPLNGYIKRAQAFTNTLTSTQRTLKLAALKAEYGI